MLINVYQGLPDSSVDKESAYNAEDSGFNSWVGKILWRMDRLPTPVFLGFPYGSAGKEMFIESLLYYCSIRCTWTPSLNPQDSPISVSQFSRSVVSDSLQPHDSQHTRPPCPPQTPGVYPNSCPLSWWCHPAISSSVVTFSSCPQALPASGSFPMS